MKTLPSRSMRKATAVAVMAGVVRLSGCSTEATIVDAGTLTTVTVDAPLYDTRTLEDNGCDPAGCVGEYTRVRWSRPVTYHPSLLLFCLDPIT